MRTRNCLSLGFGLAMVCSLGMPSAHAGIKDMYYQQLNNPSQQINTGMSYWIELRRGKTIKKVDNRTTFKSGDRIRFHVTPNIDGHAHCVMLQGSSGKQSVLFPVAGKDPSNKVTRGKDAIIPSVTFLVFDNTKGTEHVRIAVSRNNIDTTALLQPVLDMTQAMATITPNVAVDATQGKPQLLVAFDGGGSSPPAVPQTTKPPASDPPALSMDEEAIPSAESNSKDLFREDSAPPRKKPPRPHTTQHTSQVVPHKPTTHQTAHVPHRPPYRPPAGGQVAPAPAPAPTTMIVNTNTAEDLYVDISLEHS